MRPDPEALIDSLFISIARGICRDHGVKEESILIQVDPATNEKTFMVNDPNLPDETAREIITTIIERVGGMLE